MLRASAHDLAHSSLGAAVELGLGLTSNERLAVAASLVAVFARLAARVLIQVAERGERQRAVGARKCARLVLAAKVQLGRGVRGKLVRAVGIVAAVPGSGAVVAFVVVAEFLRWEGMGNEHLGFY